MLEDGLDACVVFADGSGGGDELVDAAALGACAPAIEQVFGGGRVELAGEDKVKQNSYEKW